MNGFVVGTGVHKAISPALCVNSLGRRGLFPICVVHCSLVMDPGPHPRSWLCLARAQRVGSPFRRVMVQFFLTVVGMKGNSKT